MKNDEKKIVRVAFRSKDGTDVAYRDYEPGPQSAACSVAYADGWNSCVAAIGRRKPIKRLVMSGHDSQSVVTL